MFSLNVNFLATDNFVFNKKSCVFQNVMLQFRSNEVIHYFIVTEFIWIIANMNIQISDGKSRDSGSEGQNWELLVIVDSVALIFDNVTAKVNAPSRV